MKLFFITILLASSAALANFDGRWMGSGKIDVGPDLNNYCTDMNLQIRQTSNSFSILSFKATCTGYSFTHSHLEVQIVGPDLLNNGQKVGEIDENNLWIRHTDTLAGYTYVYQLAISGEVLEYIQKIQTADGKNAVAVTGYLQLN